MSKSILTYKIKHNRDLSQELAKAKQVAEFGIKTRTLSSKDVAHFGLKSMLANQVLRKYARNKKTKKVKSIKLAVPHQGIKLENKNIWIPCLKLNIPFDKNVIKINQIELDNIYAYVSCELPDQPLSEQDKYIGIDRNATGHIAVCAIDEKIIKLGKEANHIHTKYKHIRKQAQSKKRFKFIKKLKHKESNIVKDINHKISRKIVDLAKATNRSIKLEKLTNIKEKKSFNKKSNNIKSNWSFYQLEQFIRYKAKLSGVAVLYIDPAYTSQRCSRCGLIGTRNKKVFNCESCGHNDHADANAAFNIAKASFDLRQR